jgi:hypothetical protein
LIETLNRDYSTNLNPNIILENSWVADSFADPDEDSVPDPEKPNRVIVAGASNMRRIIPLLRAVGLEVTDLSQSAWLATPENIAILVEKLRLADPDENTTVILELFGNSTYRYRQFDGTMALPFKASNGYHLEGDVGVCDDDSFLKHVATTKEVFEISAPGVKIVIPPLPRHLYTPCCNNRKHCTNFKSEGYELNMLQATTHFRPLLKDAVAKLGVQKYFVLDGVGGILGVPAGENRGAAAEIIRELKNYCGSDGVHFTETGYANLTRTVISAIDGVRSGTLTKSMTEKQGISGKRGGGTFFWRGFISPMGHAGGGADRSRGPEQHRDDSASYARTHSPGPGSWPRGGRGRAGRIDPYFKRGGRRGNSGHYPPYHHPYHR